jgi:hypothetical protein
MMKRSGREALVTTTLTSVFTTLLVFAMWVCGECAWVLKVMPPKALEHL